MESAGGAASTTIVEVGLGSKELTEVLALHRAEKRWLGFLPNAGFNDRAAAGTLLAAVSNDRVVAYILYDLPGDWVKIVHLCVDPNVRGAGLARSLVTELSERHPSRAGVQLSCRRSFPAAGLWPHLDFRPVGDRPGRSLEGHRLTVWVLDHGHPDLFTSVEDERELVAVDQMVFEDLVVDGPHGEESRRLFDDWVEELVELCVTDQVFVESNECDDDALRDALTREANAWRNLSRGNGYSDEAVQHVALLSPRAGDADHRHVAAAAAGGATYFVTRDGDLLQGAEGIHAEFGIELIRPEGLIDRLDRARRVGLYAPAALQGTEINDTRLAAEDQDRFTAALLNTGAGERAAELRGLLRPALAAPDEYEVRAFHNGSQLLGGYIRSHEDDRVKVDLLRVAASDALSRAIARQLVFAQRQEAARKRLSAVIVGDPHPPIPIREALRAEGFEPYEHEGWRCRVVTGIVAADELSEPPTDPLAAAALERSRWPLKVTGAGIPTYIISIKPGWAEDLFDQNLASQTLFPRSLGLGLSREHVYYRSTKPGSILAPARLLWYVTAGPGHPVGHLRAVSHLSDVIVGRPEKLHRRFDQLGAWSLSQVRSAADDSGGVMALRFLDTEVLAQPLHLDELRAIYADAGTSFQAPQSPLPVADEVFSRLYRRSSEYVDE